MAAIHGHLWRRQLLLDAVDHGPVSAYSGTGQGMRCDLDDLAENLQKVLRWMV